MKYTEFEAIMSHDRMQRYLIATGGDTAKAMTLYRENLRLSQEVFTIVSCFEVTLRNAIDNRLRIALGPDWLKDSILPNGIFVEFPETYRKISKAYDKLMATKTYHHTQLLATLDFGS